MKWEGKVLSPIDHEQFEDFEAWLDVGSEKRVPNYMELSGLPLFHFVGYKSIDGKEIFLPVGTAVRAMEDGKVKCGFLWAEYAGINVEVDKAGGEPEFGTRGLNIEYRLAGLQLRKGILDPIFEIRQRMFATYADPIYVKKGEQIGVLHHSWGVPERALLTLDLLNSTRTVDIKKHGNPALHANRNPDPRLYLEERIVPATPEFIAEANHMIYKEDFLRRNPQIPQ